MTSTEHVQHLLDLTRDGHRYPWTSTQLATLLEMDSKGAFISEIAKTLGMTYGQVRWMRDLVVKLGVARILGGEPDSIDHPITERDKTRRHDDAFQAAMRAAIESGLEHAPIGVFVDDSPPRFTPMIRAPLEIGYRSSAAWAVELGET